VPATVIVVIAGAWAVTEGPWDFDMTWVTIGFGVWLIGVVLGVTWHRTEGPRLRLEASGPGSAELAALKRAMVTVGTVEMALLVLGVWAMVIKPGL
jgi:hypothetical protein